ncbi:MAG: REP-associated tyrosine transposase [Gaiellaceae bacterium]|nr:REP-associated tyrosine transposase [Gaiellaceae bacterium]
MWVGATGNEPYFIDELDRMMWVRGLVQTADKHGLTCLAFCQMTTHMHLLVNAPEGALSSAMKQLNFDYSRRFNVRHDRLGQFVRRRYGNRRVERAADLLGVFAYVVLNPVKAGMCPRGEDWRWSSLASTLGLTNDFPFVDASLVLAEVGGSAARLQTFLGARWRDHLSKAATSDCLTTRRAPWGRA